MKDLRLVRVSNQAPVVLGKELGRGGEGSVHLVNGAPDLVAKVYLKRPTPAKVDKLRSMSKHASTALLKAAAWPLDLLADDSGQVRGFLMPKLHSREDLHELYSPKSRKRAFPTADFRFVARVAANLARAFAQVHAQGDVIGDVNHGNALVGRDGTVVLIDCDSFQVRDTGRVFTCDVGVPLFTPPELSGQGFRGLKRTANHDAFGLAVLLFHLLYLGRHPFAGKYSEGDMPIERAIAESRFAYGASAQLRGMTAPPGTLLLGTFGPEVAQHFERAFAPPGDGPRPTAVEWVTVLQKLEEQLVGCGAAPNHWHPREEFCCWCAHEKRTGLRVFGQQVAEAVSLGAGKIAQLWDAISSVQKPAVPTPLRMPEFGLSASAKNALGRVPSAVLGGLLGILGASAIADGGANGIYFGLLGLAGGIVLVCKALMSGFEKPRTPEKERALIRARERVARAISRWNEACLDDRFGKLRTQLEAARDRLQELPKLREARIKALAEDAATIQRNRFLSLHRIDKARLPEVSRQEIVMLESYDIDSADDVIRKESDLPHLVTPAAAKQLLAWAYACARNFQFDPANDSSADDIREIERLIARQQQDLLSTLSKGGKRLRTLAEEIEQDQRYLDTEIRSAREALRMAEQATE
jgi:DNA-binding helix-hairpin-helix protein with protein kinase domain